MFKKIAIAILIAITVNVLMELFDQIVGLALFSIFQRLLIGIFFALLCLLADPWPIDNSSSKKAKQVLQPLHRKVVGGLLLFVIILFGLSFLKCGSTTPPPASPSPVQESPTEAISPTPTIAPKTPTPIPPTITPVPATQTVLPVTPVPTQAIPTPTPSPYYSDNTIQAFDAGFRAYAKKNYGVAIPLFREAASEGYPKAEYYLGLSYEEGTGVKQNSFKAFEWYKLAAEDGLDMAQYSLGYCYLSGFGIRVNEDLAFQWFLKSAEQHNASGLLWTGYCYHKGVGVGKDYDLAAAYYSEAADLGSNAAWGRLDELQKDLGY